MHNRGSWLKVKTNVALHKGDRSRNCSSMHLGISSTNLLEGFLDIVSDFSNKMYSRSFQESKYLKFYADPENVTFPWFKNSHNKNYGYKYIINIFMLRQQTKVYFVKLQFMEPMIFRMIFCYNEWSTIILIYTIQ